MTTRPEHYDNEDEKNQWAAVWSMPDSVNGEIEDVEATVYVREKPAPASVKIWYGDGERNLQLEETENGDEERPFLFQSHLRGQNFFEHGKLDGKSKAMLKERFGIDVNKDG